MDIKVRPMQPADLDKVAEITFAAFFASDVRHGYEPAFPSVRAARNLCGAYLRYGETRAFVAEADGRISGAAFLHPRGRTAGIGPVAVEPSVQGTGIGRRLMERLLEEAGAGTSVRLNQAAFNRASFALYARLGFQVRDVEVTVIAQGTTLSQPEPDGGIRRIGHPQIDPVAALDEELTGITRRTDLLFLTHAGVTFVAGDPNRPPGYLCRLYNGAAHYLGPAAARDEETLLSLMAAAVQDVGEAPVVARVPGSQARVVETAMRWGFHVRTLGNYMVRGPWEPPRGAVLWPTFPESL